MINEALKYNYFVIQELRSLHPKTKEYKKALADLIIGCSYAALQDFKWAVPESEAYRYRQKYRKMFAIVFFFMILSVVATVLMVLIGGDDQVQEFTPEETKAFLFWMGAMFLPLALGLIAAFKARGVIGQYVLGALNQFHPDIQGIPEDVLEEIIRLKDEEFFSGERAGCYSCLELFDMEQLAEDGCCPHCGQDTIAVDDGEFALNKDFLQKAKQFWLS